VRATADTRGGEVVIDVPEVESEKVIQEFLKRGVDASKLEHPIVVDESLCIECGACISICSPKVFSFSDWKISVDKSKCIQCGLCIPACPLGALKLP
jgi:ferredoxin